MNKHFSETIGRESWICCQRGAREHYAVPRAFSRSGELESLLTDFWCPGWYGQARSLIPAPILGRRHDEIDGKRVCSFNSGFLINMLRQKFFSDDWFKQQQKQNQWFERRCVDIMSRLPRRARDRMVFAYSYGAREIFAYARVQKWKAVLGQIDPGPKESEIVLTEYRRLGLAAGSMYRPPDNYWNDWRTETELADIIVVNSSWSSECMQEAGVAGSKIVVIPCAYEPPREAYGFHRQYPAEFSRDRLMRVLFLGQTIVRKGIHLLIEAAGAMLQQPVEFIVAGGGLDIPHLQVPTNVKWVGSVPRSGVGQLYRDADVFCLPTLSDGFALTQLEAQAWKLPLVVSKRCGDVVTNGLNGLLLTEVSAAAITGALQHLLDTPHVLKDMSDCSEVSERFSLESIRTQFESISARI